MRAHFCTSIPFRFSSQRSPPLCSPRTRLSSAAASNAPTVNRMFCPPPTFLTHSRHPPTSIYRRPSPHGPSCPCPSRPMPFRIRHVSPTTRSALPTCLSDCACQLPCFRIHTILPLRLMRTSPRAPLFRCASHTICSTLLPLSLLPVAPRYVLPSCTFRPSLPPPATSHVSATPLIVGVPRAAQTFALRELTSRMNCPAQRLHIHVHVHQLLPLMFCFPGRPS